MSYAETYNYVITGVYCPSCQTFYRFNDTNVLDNKTLRQLDRLINSRYVCPFCGQVDLRIAMPHHEYQNVKTIFIPISDLFEVIEGRMHRDDMFPERVVQSLFDGQIVIGVDTETSKSNKCLIKSITFNNGTTIKLAVSDGYAAVSKIVREDNDSKSTNEQT